MGKQKQSGKRLDLTAEIAEIGRLISSAAFLMAVRKEVEAVKKGSFVVTDGRHQDGAEDYEVVVRCSCDMTDVARRIRSNIAGVQVEKIAENMLGVKDARRGR